MKILYISAFPPNRKTAGQNYSRQLLNDLSSKPDIQIDLIYWDYPNHAVDVNNTINIIEKACVSNLWSNVIKYVKTFPFFSKRIDGHMINLINNMAHNYDALYFDYSQVFLYARYVNHPIKIGMSHDVIAQKYSRHTGYRLILPWVTKSEYNCLKSLDFIFTFSVKDSNYIREHYNLQAGTVPFYIEPAILNIDYKQVAVDDYYVLYGAWNRKENQDTIVWLLKQKLFDYKIKIIGGGLPESLIKRLDNKPNIKYCGFIENPYPIIANSKGLIAPLFQGAGVKVKVIESLALGTPVIGTDITFEGIDNIKFGSKQALINISETDISTCFKICDSITKEDKIIIRNLFMNNYNSNKLVDQLSRIIN